MLSKTCSFLTLFALLLCFVSQLNGNIHKKYVLVEENLTWYEAFQACQTKNMDISSIESQAEADELLKILEPIQNKEGMNNGFWIGGHRKEKSSNVHVWVNSERPVNFNMWAPGEPNNDENNERCMEIFKDPETKKWLWNDLPCGTESVKKGFICQYN